MWLVEIDTYPYSFTNRKGFTFPDSAAPNYTVVEGPFESSTGWGVGSFWDETTKSLYWIAYSPGGNTCTLYKLRNGAISYVVIELGSISGFASVSEDTLHYDGTYFYIGIESIDDNAAIVQINPDGSENSRYINAGGIAAAGPFTQWGNSCITSGKIAGIQRVVAVDVVGRVSLMSPSPITELATIGVGSDGRGYYQPIIDKFGQTWIVSGAHIYGIDWSGPTAIAHAVGSANAAACYVPADHSIIVAGGAALYKFDLATLSVVGTLSNTYRGMSHQVGSDGKIIVGVNKLDPVAFTLATNLDITGFGLPNSFYTGGSDTFGFGRPYNASRDVFYAEDLDGFVWGLRLSVAGNALRPWLKASPQDIELTVDELNGSSSLSQLVFDVLDDPAPANTSAHRLTADMATFTFEGKRIWLKTGYVGMNRADLLTCFTGVIDTVDSMDGNNGYTFTCSGGMVKLDNVVYNTGDDGQPTDNDHPRTLTGHPIDILLDLLINELSMSSLEFDGDTLRAARDSVFAGMKFKFSITSPPAARDWIEKQIMTPLGGVMWENNLGVLKFNFMWPLNGVSSVMTLTKRDLSKTPTAGQTELVNTISYRFDKDDSSDGSGKFLSERVEKYDPSLVKYQNLPGQHIIESDGVRAGFQGYLIAALISRLIFLRYGLKNLTFEAEGQWKMLPLEPFDLILVTHPLVPDRVNGVFGITNWLLQVFDRKWLLSENKVQLRVVDASALLKYGQFKIAPDGTPTWTLASTYEKGRYMFYSDVTGKMSDGAAAPTFG
jgi:hypothetical protein